MAVDPMMTQQNPAQRYTIVNELGRGAIGRVYAARDRATGELVALKTLDPALFSEPDANLAGLFLKNARSAARLRHRNIVKILDAGEAGGTLYVAMELLEGESLRHVLDDRALSIAHAIRIFDDIASALAYAHEEGMLHRGVKPSNIVVLHSGVAKLTDFGIGQLGEAALRYMSPEQVRGDPVDHRSDMFSLGTVLYEMLTRRAPFEGSSAQEIRESILHAEPPLPSKVNPHVPSVLDGIVFSMLAGNPDDRFANVRILLRDLQRVEEGLGLGPDASARADEPAASVPPPQPAAKREPTLRISQPTPYEHDAGFIMDRERWPQRSPESRAATYAALALMLAVLAIGLGVFLHYSPSTNEPRTAASRMQETPATAAASSPSTALTRVAETTREPATAPAAAEALPQREAGEANAQRESAVASAPSRPAAPAPVAEAIKEPFTVPVAPKPAVAEAKIPDPQPGGTAKLIIAVSPQGELYIDGKHYGTTPPITTLDLEPGMHRIEIRSGSWKPYLTYVAVQAGEQRRIRHDFGARLSRPPS